MGDAFAAFRGNATDGRAFIADAIARGAGAVLWEALAFRWNSAWDVANVAVDDLKAKLGAIADLIYGNPSHALWVVGVTGTNGKTSCTHWIAQCLGACGRPGVASAPTGARTPAHSRAPTNAATSRRRALAR